MRMAASAAIVGFAVHHLFDTPIMMPAIAVVGLILLAILIVPTQPVPLSATWRVVGHPMGMAVLWTVLLIVGFWQSSIQSRYLAVLEAVADVTPYRDGAIMLQTIVNDDPRQPAYRLQLAYMLGRAAATDESQAFSAIEAYRSYLTLEPNNAVAWLNTAALAWQIGDTQQAIESVKRATTLAPEWTLATQLATYYQGGVWSDEVAITESPYAANTSYFQYLRLIFTDELLPQIGWR